MEPVVGFPFWSWLFAIAVLVLGVWLNAMVLRKAGLSQWWALLFLVPIAWLIGVWVFAFVRWPRIDAVRTTPPSDYAGGWDVPPRGREDDQPRPYVAPDPKTRHSWDNDRRR